MEPTLPVARRWTVASSHRRGVHWEPFGTEAEAQERYNGIAMTSKVLFSPDGKPMTCYNKQFDAAGGEVASIVKAYVEARDTSEVDDSPALRAPREWGCMVRWAMKPVCRITFNRSTVAYFGTGPLRMQSLCYFDVTKSPGVKGCVALTLDDAPCRQGRQHSQVRTVLELLRRFDAKATFMAVGSFIEGHENDLVDLLRDGHELGNHGMLDRPYHKDSFEQFSQAAEACSSRIRALQRDAGVAEGVKWFRAPHGKYTKSMEAALEAKGLTNVMCDTYASCPIIQDGDFIGDSLANQAQHGSIILIHMPEANFREWCLTGLTRLLEGLQKRGLRTVTVSQLAALANAHGASKF